MKTLFRADDFYENMGDFLGFFETKEEAEWIIHHKNPVKIADGTFSLITEFQVELPPDVDLDDKTRMLQEDIWGSGNIINDYYYY